MERLEDVFLLVYRYCFTLSFILSFIYSFVSSYDSIFVFAFIYFVLPSRSSFFLFPFYVLYTSFHFLFPPFLVHPFYCPLSFHPRLGLTRFGYLTLHGWAAIYKCCSGMYLHFIIFSFLSANKNKEQDEVDENEGIFERLKKKFCNDPETDNEDERKGGRQKKQKSTG